MHASIANSALVPEQISNDEVRHDWTETEIGQLFSLPFNDLLFRAQLVHRESFDPNRIQVSRLLSIKTGKMPR